MGLVLYREVDEEVVAGRIDVVQPHGQAVCLARHVPYLGRGVPDASGQSGHLHCGHGDGGIVVGFPFRRQYLLVGHGFLQPGSIE